MKSKNTQIKKVDMTTISLSQRAKRIKLGYYEHYKKIKCEVLGVAIHSETLEEFVIYKELNGKNLTWIRPLDMFIENVTIGGKSIPRFKYIGKTI